MSLQSSKFSPLFVFLGFFLRAFTWFALVASFINACAGTREGKFNVSEHGKDVFTLLAAVMVMPVFKYLWRYSFHLQENN